VGKLRWPVQRPVESEAICGAQCEFSAFPIKLLPYHSTCEHDGKDAEAQLMTSYLQLGDTSGDCVCLTGPA
jgi:hypothetical protein